MGFCVFNNAAIAARTYAQGEGGRVLVLDFDYHHGNGTQACAGGGVSYVGTHADPAYPGTGDPRDNRVTAGAALVNVPIDARGIATEGFVAIHTRALRALAERIRPRLIVVSAGYDVVAGDPVGDLGVDASFARQMGRLVREIADTYCDGRALYVLEGGYDPAVLGSCIADTIVGHDEGTPVERTDIHAIPPAQRALVREIEAATPGRSAAMRDRRRRRDPGPAGRDRPGLHRRRDRQDRPRGGVRGPDRGLPAAAAAGHSRRWRWCCRSSRCCSAATS